MVINGPPGCRQPKQDKTTRNRYSTYVRPVPGTDFTFSLYSMGPPTKNTCNQAKPEILTGAPSPNNLERRL